MQHWPLHRTLRSQQPQLQMPQIRTINQTQQTHAHEPRCATPLMKQSASVGVFAIIIHSSIAIVILARAIIRHRVPSHDLLNHCL